MLTCWEMAQGTPLNIRPAGVQPGDHISVVTHAGSAAAEQLPAVPGTPDGAKDRGPLVTHASRHAEHPVSLAFMCLTCSVKARLLGALLCHAHVLLCAHACYSLSAGIYFLPQRAGHVIA